MTDNKEQGVSAEDSKVDAVKSSVLEPNMTALKRSSENSVDKKVAESKAAESSENSPTPESAPGFLIVYAVAGILLLAFGSDFGKGSRRNP
ncbi:hypothetical protein [Methanosarcina sp. UBA5]|uniref:hypothetical protein n=1 Tax=Methanosarcina sp. UBA5 TaxID=1915593 RepID=UPI0025DE58FC|nr:hypothetical protein [Methanosarcina sp. UBA5]